MNFDPQLWLATKGFRLRILAAILLGLLSLSLGMLRFVVLGWLVARLYDGADAMELLLPAGGLVGVILLRVCLEYGRAVVAHHTAARIQDRLRLALFDKLVALGPSWLAGNRSGGLVLSTVDGVEQLQVFFGQFLPQVAVAILTPVLMFAALAHWDVPVAGILSGAAILAIALPAILKQMGKDATMRRVKSFKAFGEDFLDAVQGLPTLKAFGQGRAFGDRLAERAHQLADSTMFVLQASLMTRALTDLAIAGGAATAIAVGAWRVSHGDMGLEALLIVLMAGTEVFRPIRDLRSLLHQGMTANAAAVGIKALLDAKSAKPVAEGEARPDLTPSVAFRQVAFAYDSERGDALRAVSFAVKAGERVGIVGRSGSGKSTIVKLLLRLYDPTSGTVDIGGQDVAGMAADHVRDQIAVVQQDTYLFYGTVEDNIRLARPDATAEQTEEAARAANAHAFITGLPEGYQTMIGERGLRLSGGQRQRIAIARAILRDAPILVLDEALSSVDAENESLIQDALDRLTQGRTTIVLAHRLSSVIGADRILVVREGRIVQSGTHAEMIRCDGPYRELMAEQAERQSDVSIMPADEAVEVKAADMPARSSTIRSPGRTTGEIAADRLGPLQLLATLFRFIAPWRSQLVLTVLSGVGRVFALIGVSIASALAVAAVKSGESYGSFLLWMAVLVPIASFLQWNESWRSHDMAYRLLAQMRVDLFRRLEKLAPAYLLRRRTGDLVSLGTQDVETIEYFFAHVLAPAMVALLVPLSVLVALSAIAWQAALVLLPFLAFAALAPVFDRRRVDAVGGRARERLGQLNAFMLDTVQGMSELVAFGAAGKRRSELEKHVRAYQEVRIRLRADLSFQVAKQEAIAACGMIAVLVVCALLARQSLLDVHLVPLMALLATASFLPVSELGQSARQLADSIASTRRVHAVNAEPVTIVDGNRRLPQASGGSGASYSRVGFTYGEDLPEVLRDVSVEIPAGSKVAIVGASGAGKTTLANLLMRFWDPSEGSISIDGVDIKDVALDELRSRIALVAQDTYLFNATLADNILLAKSDASTAELDSAIRRAALSELIDSLPQGLQTHVGERGVQLSGGQRQRVAIARAFLKNAPILILDEATSHLDALTERRVRAALDDLMGERTTIAIAHRLSTIRRADLILVMRDGRIAERGNHGELMTRGGYYAQLVARQTLTEEGPDRQSRVLAGAD